MTYPVDQASYLSPDEKKDIFFDCTNQLVDQTGVVVDTIVNVTWTSDPDELTLEGDFIEGVYVGTFCSAPTAGTSYRVKALVTTLAGRKFEALWHIEGVDKT